MKLNELKSELKEKENEFDEISSFRGAIRERMAGVDYTEWNVLKAKIEYLKKGISACEEILNSEIQWNESLTGFRCSKDCDVGNLFGKIKRRLEYLNQSQQTKPKSAVQSAIDENGVIPVGDEDKTADTQTLIKEMSHYKSRCVDLMCENDELKKALSQRNQEILEIIDKCFECDGLNSCKFYPECEVCKAKEKLKQQLTNSEGEK